MSISSASYIGQMDITYPYDNISQTSTASLSWAAIQEAKRPVKNSFPNVSSEVSASPSEFNQLIGMGGTTVVNMLANLSATLTLQKLGVDDTATAAVHWDGASKYVQTATPSDPAEGDIWFQI